MEMWRYLSDNKFNDTKVINMYNEVSDQVEVITVYFYQDGQVKLINQNNETVSPKSCYPLDDMRDYMKSVNPNNLFKNKVKRAIIQYDRNNKIDSILQ